MEVRVWICPECNAYYGSSAVHGIDLHREINYESMMRHSVDSNPAQPKAVSTRGQCHICLGQGKKIDRIRVSVTVPERMIEDGAELCAARIGIIKVPEKGEKEAS